MKSLFKSFVAVVALGCMGVLFVGCENTTPGKYNSTNTTGESDSGGDQGGEADPDSNTMSPDAGDPQTDPAPGNEDGETNAGESPTEVDDLNVDLDPSVGKSDNEDK